jgi:pimeloyl-ACP methyl ester carboxylesterase
MPSVLATVGIRRSRRTSSNDGIYQTLTMPVLGLGGPGYSRLKANLETKAPGSPTFRIQGSGHFIAEEKPAVLLSYLHDFLD